MSTVGEKVSQVAGKTADIIFNPATAAQVVGRDAIAMLIDRAMAVNASDSLIAATQAARVEPLVLVDTDALYVEELYDVLQSLQSIFAGYYLQAIQLDSSLGNVKVAETLGKFNPNGNPNAFGALQEQALGTLDHAMAVKHLHSAVDHPSNGRTLGTAGTYLRLGQHMFATESYRDALPDFREIDDVALEAKGGNSRKISKVESPFASDADYKNWKAQREVQTAKQRDRQETERVNDRRKRNELESTRERERQEDRDHQLGQRQELANDKAIQKDRQLTQDKRQDRQDRNREWDRLEGKERQQHLDAQAETERRVAARKAEEEAGRVSTHIDDLSDVKDAANLSVGKLLNVEIKNNGQTFQIPVAVRLVVNTIPSASLVHILSLSQNVIKSAKERFHAWKAGRLSFVKDLIFARDLIDEHRRSLMKSSDSVYHNVIKREKQSLTAALVGGVPSVAAASNMVVTTTNTIEEIELTMPGKFKDFHARQKIFEETSLMIVAVIDKEWQRVTFYHRGLPDATEVSFRDLKTSIKGNGPDVSDILKAYTLGNAPRL
jgi:hypothetical protein